MTDLRTLRWSAAVAVVALLAAPVVGHAKGPEDYELIRKSMVEGREVEADEKPWEEVQYQLPPAPDVKNLVPIDVGSLTENKFAVDEPSVTFGADQVVRYTLVATSPGGARNVSYEGMRCATAERRLYAFGRADGSWSKARNGQWLRISENNLNRHHAALFRDYFCTPGGSVSSTDEARRVLRSGNPAAVSR
ncbi:CNP1-like family protein [Azospira restricta]|nr:CNP1-like family protein [Azospira restricta]